MILTKACEYGIRAVVFLAQPTHLQRKSSQQEIADAIGSPAPFTGKILQQLQKKGVVCSSKGKQGGFFLDQNRLEQLNVRDIVDALEGTGTYDRCIMGLSACTDKQPCPLHRHFQPLKKNIQQLFEKTKISDMTPGIENGKQFLQLP